MQQQILASPVKIPSHAIAGVEVLARVSSEYITCMHTGTRLVGCKSHVSAPAQCLRSFPAFPLPVPSLPCHTRARTHTHLPLHLLRPPCSALPRSVAQMGLKKQQRLRPWGRPLGRYQTASPLPTPPRAHPFFFFCTPSPPPPTSEVSGNVVLRRRAW